MNSPEPPLENIPFDSDVVSQVVNLTIVLNEAIDRINLLEERIQAFMSHKSEDKTPETERP